MRNSLTLTAVFPILTIHPDTLIRDEQLGSKNKFWFEMDGQLWLFKWAREHTGEDWAEKIAAEVARRIGLSAARVELAEYQGRRGSISLSFVEKGESLVHGNEILAGQILGYDRLKKAKQSDHTLDNIANAVEKMMPTWHHLVLRDLAWYPTLDALIGNTDRHHENWGLLTQDVDTDQGTTMQVRLAPSFDHASSLGRELRDEKAAAILATGGTEAYIRRGHGGIYWQPTDPRGANPLGLIELAVSKYPDYFRAPLQAVAATPVSDLQVIVDQVPGTVMSAPSRQFAKAILAFTHSVLSGCIP